VLYLFPVKINVEHTVHSSCGPKILVKIKLALGETILGVGAHKVDSRVGDSGKSSYIIKADRYLNRTSHYFP